MQLPGGPAVTTGSDATPAAPLQTSVAVPAGGTGGDVTITQGQSDASELPAFKLLDQQVDIEAPAQTPPAFLTLTFEFDAATLAAAGLTVDQVVVYRNGVAVASPCTTAGATPDPCVVGPRTTDAQGDGVIVVRTSQASSWNFSGSYILQGPFQPVDPQPTLNTVKAGQTMPVTFSLGGNFGLDVFADGYPKSEGGALRRWRRPTRSRRVSNGAGLTYDAPLASTRTTGRRPRAGQGHCRTLTIRFIDGSELEAELQVQVAASDPQALWLRPQGLRSA